MKVSEVLRMSWTDRVDLLAVNVRRMFRTGAQTTIVGIGVSDATPISLYALDWTAGVGFFVGGCIAWILTTLAAPPKD